MAELIALVRAQEALKTEERILRVQIIRVLAADGQFTTRKGKELVALMESRISTMQLNKASFDDLLDQIEALVN